MDINELDRLYQRYLRGEVQDDVSISALIIAQRVRIEELEKRLASEPRTRTVSMNNVVAGDIAINGITLINS